jgi:hypothetical protein
MYTLVAKIRVVVRADRAVIRVLVTGTRTIARSPVPLLEVNAALARAGLRRIRAAQLLNPSGRLLAHANIFAQTGPSPFSIDAATLSSFLQFRQRPVRV